MSALDIPGFSALQCVISSLRDTAHFTDQEGDLTDKLRDLRDWGAIRAAVQAAQPEAVIAWMHAESERIAAVHEYNAAHEAAKKYDFGAVDLNPHYQRMTEKANAAHRLLAPMHAALLASAPTPEPMSAPTEAKPAQQSVKLDEIEQYRMQMAGISTAALGYWKEGDDIHPDYDTVPLRDVAKLYAKYAAHYQDAKRWQFISDRYSVSFMNGKFTSLNSVVSEDWRQSVNTSVDRMMAGDWSDADAANEKSAQAGPSDAVDATRWRTFIGLDYELRAEWATNLSLAPVLTEWVDNRTEHLRTDGHIAEAKPAQDAVDAERWPNKYREQPQRFGPYDEDDDISNLMGDGS